MAAYTVRGSKQLDQRIDKELDVIVDTLMNMPESQYWESIALMGGYARGEGTPFIKNGEQYSFNDYDIVILSKTRVSRKALRKKEIELSKRLGIEVDLFLHTRESLESAEFSLMNYEFKNGHRVLWGKPLNFRDYPVEELPLIEGTRLLLNRGTLLLFNQKDSEERLTFLKYIYKVYLAIGDSALLLTNRYDVSYVKKKELIHSIDLMPESAWLKSKYLEAIDFKEWCDPEKYARLDLERMQREVVEKFIHFFRWYEEQRMKKSFKTPLHYFSYLEEDGWIHSQHGKSLALNLLWKTPFLNFKWMMIYPRWRLYPALWLMLQTSRSREEEKLLSQLVGHRYFKLWERFG